MQRTFLRCHILAWMTAIVLGLTFGILSGVAAPPKMVLHYPPCSLMAVAITVVMLVLFRATAAMLGAYDLLVMLVGCVVVSFAFGLLYLQGVESFLPDDGHTFFNVLTPAEPPLDFLAQLGVFAFYFIWLGAVVYGAIWWKRKRTLNTEQLDRISKLKLRTALTLDLALVVMVTFVLLRSQTMARIAEGKPENIVARASAVLLAKGATSGDCAKAIFDLAKIHNDAATDLLRHAAQEQPPPVNLAAAAELLGRDDMVGLAVLEPYLRHNSTLQSQALPTSSATPATLGPTVASFGFNMNLGNSLANVRDPAAIPILMRLTTNTDPQVRAGTIQAMRNTKSPETIDFFVKGLDDPDFQTRQLSAWALEEILIEHDDLGWKPPHYTSRDDEQAIYLQSLRDWIKTWNARKSSR